MIREIFHDLKEGAADALRDFATVIAMPFTVAKSLAHSLGKALSGSD
jgi:hypothetical protein